MIINWARGLVGYNFSIFSQFFDKKIDENLHAIFYGLTKILLFFLYLEMKIFLTDIDQGIVI